MRRSICHASFVAQSSFAILGPFRKAFVHLSCATVRPLTSKAAQSQHGDGNGFALRQFRRRAIGCRMRVVVLVFALLPIGGVGVSLLLCRAFFHLLIPGGPSLLFPGPWSENRWTRAFAKRSENTRFSASSGAAGWVWSTAPKIRSSAVP